MDDEVGNLVESASVCSVYAGPVSLGCRVHIDNGCEVSMNIPTFLHGICNAYCSVVRVYCVVNEHCGGVLCNECQPGKVQGNDNEAVCVNVYVAVS